VKVYKRTGDVKTQQATKRAAERNMQELEREAYHQKEAYSEDDENPLKLSYTQDISAFNGPSFKRMKIAEAP
jgi:hypothetical protein